MRAKLTQKENEVWGFILGYTEDYGISPTMTEIADFVGSTNRQAGGHFVTKLEEKGYIIRTRGKWRNISIIEKP